MRQINLVEGKVVAPGGNEGWYRGSEIQCRSL